MVSMGDSEGGNGSWYQPPRAVTMDRTHAQPLLSDQAAAIFGHVPRLLAALRRSRFHQPQLQKPP